MSNSISTAIKITDGFSPALKGLHNALSIVTSSLITTQKQFNKQIDTSAFIQAQRELAEVSSHFDKIAQETQQATQKQNQYNNALKNGESAANNLWGKIKGLVAAYATFESGKQLIMAADNYGNIKSRLDLINDGLQTTDQLEKLIRQSADRTYASFADTADIVGKFGINAERAFSSNKEIIDFVEQLNKHLVIAGTDTAAAQGAMLQLTQAMSAGVLRGEELNSVLEGMPTVARAIADYFGEQGVKGSLKEIAEQGLITSDIVKAALFNAAEETNQKFEEMQTTFGRLWNLFKNKANEALTPVFKKLNSISGSETARKIAIGLGYVVGTIGKGLMYVMDLIQDTFNFIQDNIYWIAPIVGVIGAAFVALGASIAFAKLQAIWHAVASALQTAAIVALEFATHGASAGFAMLATAMSVNPIMLYIYAVIALIGIFYLAIAIINKFCGTSISATGLIAGAFAFLGATIYNMLVNLYNNFAIFAEFLINVFKNPVYSIKKLFINLATNFIDTVIAMTKGWDKFATSFANAMIDAVNWVIEAWNSFIDLLPDSVSSALGIGKGTTFEHTASITSDLENSKAWLESLAGEKPKDYTEIPRLAYQNVGQNTLNAYQWGSELADSISEKFNLSDMFGGSSSEALKEMLSDEMMNNAKDLAKDYGGSDSKAADDMAKAADKMGNAAKDIAKSAASMTKNYDEEMRFMRELGQREAINRFTTAQVKVMQNNSNHIANGADTDSIIQKLNDGLREALNVAAERG